MKQKAILEYLRRSYFAVDGLWFVMIEEESSFDKALEIDTKVWEVLPKIQAREVKKQLGLEGNGLSDFLRAIEVKLEAEEYEYEQKRLDDDHAQISIHKCPWLAILKKTKRERFAPKIGDSICPAEFRGWLREFGQNLDFNIECTRCKGYSVCRVNFYAK